MAPAAFGATTQQQKVRTDVIHWRCVLKAILTAVACVRNKLLGPFEYSFYQLQPIGPYEYSFSQQRLAYQLLPHASSSSGFSHYHVVDFDCLLRSY